ncbi:FliM/FliN family flagellar motor switch protein [Trinickia mobilis]|uniref:FliM/FliN family flagellar motor switch protein n=1 Tax=Trinickia mobilis TaxID=2816356 RepID=UPI001A8D0E4C|nr:FliM/FliN family flagellar motor switch protein [Trinickia mobilis]
MDAIDDTDLDPLLDDLRADTAPSAPVEAAKPPRDNLKLLARIPVTLTLEVGSATLSLAELMQIGSDSVLELDRLAGEPLVIKANGVAVGLAEVVVAGENYGLRVVEIGNLQGLGS